MDGLSTLIAAYAEEDRRLLKLADAYPLSSRDLAPGSYKYSLKQTLGHLAFWDGHAVRHYSTLCGEGDHEPISLTEFEKRHKNQLRELVTEPWELVLESYRDTTQKLITFLKDHWSDLTAEARDSFKIPLKHRRYHRRKLEKMLADILPPADDNRAARQHA